MDKSAPPKELKARSKVQLNWLWNLDHRKLHAEGKRSGVVLYRLPREFKGKLCKKLGICPIYEAKDGTVQKFRFVQGKGRKYRMWDLITIEDELALKLAAAIHDILGIPADVHPDRHPEKRLAPGILDEESETEMLLKKFVGA